MASGERYKGHDQLLEAWPAIQAAVPGAKLLVAGGGDDLSRLRASAAALDGVHFLGYVPDAELARLYRKCRLLLFPSRREGFGLAAMEAAARGAAVVGLAGTVLEELFPNGGVVLAQSQDPGVLAEAAIGVLGYPERAQPIADAGRTRVEANFLEEHFVARVREALQEWLI
jgi:phosphatidylinositol alpha-1,6-mannosyltransferase